MFWKTISALIVGALLSFGLSAGTPDDYREDGIPAGNAPATPSKGAIWIGDGSNWLKIDRGANGKVLIVDDSLVLGLKWADAAAGVDVAASYTWTGTHTFDLAQIWKATTTPANPASGYFKTYVKSNGKIYVLNSAGVESEVGSGSVTNVALGSGLSGGPITTTGTIELRLDAAGTLSKTLGAGLNELGIAVGGISNAQIAGGAAIDWTKLSKTGSSLLDFDTRSAGDLSSGTLPDGRFPATLPALSGVNLTALNASALGSGTIPDARFPATLPALLGVNLTALNASNLASGTLPDARFPATLPAASGVNLTALNASNISSGTLAMNRGGTGQVTKQAAFDALSPLTTQSDLIYFDGTNNVRLAKGTGGQVLAMNPGATAPVWIPAGGTGTVTSVATGSGLSGGTITTTGTVDLRLDVTGTLSKTLGAGNNELGIASGGILNAHVNASAAIDWSKINKTGSSIADFTTRSAADLSSGTLPDGRFPATLPVASGVNLTALNASNLASGTVPDARFPATLPVASGVNLTALNASNLASGTVPDARFPATLPVASGVNLTALNASNLGSGTVPDARFPATLPALSGVNLTALNASNLGSGTVPDARFPATLPALSGVNLTALNATNLASGTVAIARGGTGAGTATAAFDALSPLTTGGDTIYHNGTNNVRLAKGSNGEILTLAAGVPTWAAAPSTGAPTGATYWTATADAGLSAEYALGALGTGIVKNTTGTGVPSIAVAGDFPTLNQSTTGSAATLTTARDIYGNSFNGSASLTQIIGSPFGGTGNGFTKFTGPTTTERTFTLPDFNATLIYNGGAGGTPNSITLTNGTGLPLTSGVTGTLPIENGGTNGTTAAAAFASIAASATSYPGIISVTVNTDQNDWNPAGLADASTIKVNCTATFSLTGMVGGTNGRKITIINVGSTGNLIQIQPFSGSSSAGNLFARNLDSAANNRAMIVYPDHSITFIYDATDTYWRQVASSMPVMSLQSNLNLVGTLPVASGGTGTTTSTGTVNTVLSNSPTLVTPVLGAATATSINGLGITSSTGTLAIANGKTLTQSNSLTYSGTDGSSVAFGAGGTVAFTSNNLSAFAATTSAQLRGVLNDESGTGNAYFQGGDIGTPSAGVLTSATGLPISTGVSGLGANVATFLATPTHTNFAAAITGETGTGAPVFDTSPTLSGSVVNSGSMNLTGVITPTALSANVNNYAPTGYATATIMRLSGNASWSITGMVPGASGQHLILHNIGSFNITLVHNSGSSTAANTFIINNASYYTLVPNGTCQLYYDGTSSRWRMATPSMEDLSPANSAGDIITHNGSNHAKVGIGSTNQILSVVGGYPAWTSGVNPNVEVNLTHNTATTVATYTVPTMTAVGGTLVYTVTCSNGSEVQSNSGTYKWHIYNKADTFSTPDVSHTQSTVVSTGTLAVTFSFTTDGPTDAVTLKCTAASSLTPTTLKIVYNNADGSVGTITIPAASVDYSSLTSAGATSVLRKNRIINGNMEIWQRTTGTSTTATNSTLHCDRWWNSLSYGGTLTCSRDTTVVPTHTEAGMKFRSSFKYSTTQDNAVAAGDLISPYQVIEGYNIADLIGDGYNKGFTASFWVRSSKTGIYCVTLSNKTLDRSYSSQYTINAIDTWEKKTITVTSAPSGGTWGSTNDSGLYVFFTLMAGASWNANTNNTWSSNADDRATSSQVNWADTNGATFYLTGVQLEPGTNATPYESRSFQQELALCQRYTYVHQASGASQYIPFSGHAYNTSSGQGIINLPVSMRTTPTLVATPSEFSGYDGSSVAALNSFAISSTTNNPSYVFVTISQAGTTWAASRGMTVYANSSGNKFIFESEL